MIECIASKIRSCEQFASGEVSEQITQEYISDFFETVTLRIKEIHREIIFKTEKKYYEKMSSKVHELYHIYREREESAVDAMDRLINEIEKGELPIWYKENKSYCYEENGILYGSLTDICHKITENLVNKGSDIVKKESLSKFCNYDFAVWAKYNPEWYGIKAIRNDFKTSKIPFIVDSYNDVISRIPVYGTIMIGASYPSTVTIIKNAICESLDISRYTEAVFMLKKSE